MGRVATFGVPSSLVISEYPVGSVVGYAGATAPLGWLLCDGAAVSRNTYAALFAAVGTTYGAGDGTTTFNLPNLKGRVIVGRDAADTDWDTLGETRGAKTHTLTIAELAAHNHGYGNAWTNAPNDGPSDINRYHVAVGLNNDHGLGTLNNGSGTAHNNLQPSFVLNFIIRVESQVRVSASPLWTPTSPAQYAGGIVAPVVGDLVSGAAVALSKAAAEEVRLTSAPTQTFAGRRYKITACISTSIGGAWTYAELRIRRGTTLAGAVLSRMYYPRSGWQTMRVEGFDVPGAQASQQWVMTHALDASVCDLYQAAGIWVEDVGPG